MSQFNSIGNGVPNYPSAFNGNGGRNYHNRSGVQYTNSMMASINNGSANYDSSQMSVGAMIAGNGA